MDPRAQSTPIFETRLISRLASFVLKASTGLSLLVLAACGAGGSGSSSDSSGPPVNLVYEQNPVYYAIGTPIAPNAVTSSKAVSNYSISPEPPPGLSLDPSTGTVSGTPTEASALANYTVTADNPYGSDFVILQMGVVSGVPAISYSSNNNTFYRGFPITPVNVTNSGGAIQSCSVNPALPSGLALNSSTCQVTGNPTTLTGSANYEITASNVAGSSSPAAITIVVNDNTPSISYSTASYTFTKNAAIPSFAPGNAGGGITSCVASPTLPAGLSISGNCTISGTPSATSAEASYAITGTNTAGSSSASINITVQDAAPSISYSTNVYSFFDAVPISPSVSPSDGGGAITSCSSYPSLPSGMTLSSTCAIAGTPHGASPISTYTITATNVTGTSQEILFIQVTETPPSLGYSGSPYTFHQNTAITTVMPTDTGGEVTSCTSSPALPTGLSLSSSCAISGTPTVAAASASYSITGTNSAGSSNTSISILVESIPPVFSYPSSPYVFTKGALISTILPSSTSTAIASCASSPALPAGLTLGSNCNISGTPTAITAATNYTVTGTSSTSASGTATIRITVNDVVPSITYAGSPYNFDLNTVVTAQSPANTGGTITSCTSSPTLPAGLSLSSTTCAISGTPTALSSATAYSITATNTGGSSSTPVSIQVTNAAPIISYSPSSQTYTSQVAISTWSVTNTGGSIGSCSVSPALPAGLGLSPTTCAITGTPTAVSASANYIVAAINNGGSATATITIKVVDTLPAFSYSGSPYSFGINTAIATQTPTSTGGVLSSCASNPALPAGLSLSSSCVISGTPSVQQPATNYAITATNTAGSATANISITIISVPNISYAGPYTFTKGVAISTITPTNSGSPATSCASSPALPAGLSLASSCVISGTPSALSGATNYTITNSDSSGSGASATVNITVVDAAPTLVYSPTSFTFTNNTAISAVTPTLGGGAVTACTSSPTLPAGLSINNATCVITGTPTAYSASQIYAITASNTGGSVTAALTIQVNDNLPVLSYSGSPYSWKVNTSIGTITPTNTGGAVTACSASPSLPAGITLSNLCVLTGTPTTMQTATNYTLSATNSAGTASVNISIAVITVPNLSYAGPYVLTEGLAVSTITPTNSGSAATTCTTSTLPTGLTLNSNCTITGTPTALSANATYTIANSNSAGSGTNASVQLSVVAVAPTISYSSSTYTFNRSTAIGAISATLGGGAPTTCTSSPTLPAGLSIAGTTCQITGTPTAYSSSQTYTITATNTGGSASATLTMQVNDNLPALTFSGSPYSWAINTALSAITPTNTGGAVVSCTANPTLPAGITLSNLCVLSGTPTTQQTAANYTLSATNSGGTASVNISIAVITAPVLSFPSSPYTLGLNEAMTAINPTNTGSATTSCSGTLPAGLMLNAVTCQITGTPTTAQSATNYTVTGMNLSGSSSATISIAVVSPPLISYSPSSELYTLRTGTVDIPVTNTGGPISSCSIAPALPSGMNISSTTCAITGAPDAVSASTNYTITATNAAGSATASLTIQIQDQPEIVYYGYMGINGSWNQTSEGSENAFRVTEDGVNVVALTENSSSGLSTIYPSFNMNSGAAVVFSSLTALSDGTWNGTGSGSDNIWSANAGGGDYAALTTNTAASMNSDNPPVFSPNGSQIVFSSKMDVSGTASLSHNIFIMNADGSGLTPLTKNTSTGLDSVSPVFSPSGTTIYFTSIMNKSATTTTWNLAANTANNIWSITTAGAALTRITNATAAGKDCVDPFISSDGSTIVYSSISGGSSYNIWHIAASASAANGTQLTSNTNAGLDSRYPKLSNDLTKIVFQSLMNTGYPGSWNRAASASENVWEVTGWTGTGTFTPLTTSTASGLDSITPVFAPDDSKIIFSSLMTVNGVSSLSHNIWIMGPTGASPTPVTQNTNTGLDSYLSTINVMYIP